MGFTRVVAGVAVTSGVVLTSMLIGAGGAAAAATPTPTPTPTSQGLTVGLLDLPVLSIAVSSRGLTIGLLPLPSATPLVQVTVPGVGLDVLGQGRSHPTTTPTPVASATGHAPAPAGTVTVGAAGTAGATPAGASGRAGAVDTGRSLAATPTTTAAAPPHVSAPKQPGAVGTFASALRMSYPWLLGFAAGTGVLAVSGILLLSALPGLRRRPFAAAQPSDTDTDTEIVAAPRDPDWDYTFDRTEPAVGAGAGAGLRLWMGARRGRAH